MPEQAADVVLIAVVLSVAFNFISGFQDPVSSIATSIATRALSPPAALSLLAVMSFLGALISHEVAFTVATGVAEPGLLDPTVITAAVAAATGWSLLVWYHEIPSSSSHALISGLFGAAAMKALMTGQGGINWATLGKIATALFTSPVFGFIAGFLIFRLLIRFAQAFFENTPIPTLNRFFARLQPVSAALMSFSNGSNDAQKTMGLIALALYQGGMTEEFEVPLWVTLSCAGAMSLGALMGGIKVIKTVATRITEMRPVHGFCAEAGSAGVVLGASLLGMPVSTTHVAISSVVGVGWSRSVRSVQRKVALTILYTWAATIPSSILAAAAFYWIMAKTGALFFFAALAFCGMAVAAFRHGKRGGR